MRGFIPWLFVILGALGALGFGWYYTHHSMVRSITGYSNWQNYIGKYDVVNNINYVYQLPYQNLSEEEKQWILHMREEEKLARDVYLTLYEKWGLPIFNNIARSEQNHMNAVKALIVKYNLTDPVEEVNDEVGKFVNPEIQDLYNKLVEEGSKSIVDALKVGATIEDLDIKDLEEAINETDNEDIKWVFENLMRGSRNHLRAFERNLERYGETYTCQYISEEECQQIINSNWETGMNRYMNRSFRHPHGRWFR